MFSLNKINKEKLREYYIYPVTEGFVLALVAMLLTSITAYFIYFHAMKIISLEIKEGLLRTVSGIASCLDGDKIKSFNSPDQKNDKEYLKMLRLLQKARLATRGCTYLYVNRMVNDKVYFILDPTPVDASGTPLFTDEKNIEASVPMTEYPDASKDLRLALKNKQSVVTSEPYTDEWGTFYSAYVPIFDKEGVCVGTLGADLLIDKMIDRLKPMKDATKRAFFVAFILAILMGTIVWFARRFAKQLNDSRFKIYNDLYSTLKFAAKSYTIMGKQLRRMASIAYGFINSLNASLSQKPLNKTKIESDIRVFSEFLSIVDEIGAIKSKESVKVEADFYFSEIQQSLKKEFLNSSNITFTTSKDIPDKVNSDINLYLEIIRRIINFYRKTINDNISIDFILVEEEINSLTILNKFSAKFDITSESSKNILQKIASESKQEEFYDDFALVQASDLLLVRELIYLMNSGFDIDITDDIFHLSFEAHLNKYSEKNALTSDANS